MSVRKRALLLTIAAAGAVAALLGAVVEGFVAIGFALEAYLLCAAYQAPRAPDEGEEDDGWPGGGGGWEPPDVPPDRWPPMDPAARDADRAWREPDRPAPETLPA